MKKLNYILITIISMTFLFLMVSTACSNAKVVQSPIANESQSKQPLNVPQLITQRGIDEVLLNNEILEINIYNSEADGTVGKNLIGTFIKTDDLNKFIKIIQAAKPIKGVIKAVNPDYFFNVKLKNNKNISLLFWKGKLSLRQSGMFIDVNSSTTGYSLTEESSQKLLYFVE